MKAPDAVARDALLEAGLDVSLWHVRCLAAYRADVERHGVAKWTEYNTPAAHAETRLKSDASARDIDALHSEAQWALAERTAQTSRWKAPAPCSRCGGRGDDPEHVGPCGQCSGGFQEALL